MVHLCAALFVTVATVRRETGSWKHICSYGYISVCLAYFASFVTYQIASPLLGVKEVKEVVYASISDYWVLVVWSAIVVF